MRADTHAPCRYTLPAPSCARQGCPGHPHLPAPLSRPKVVASSVPSRRAVSCRGGRWPMLFAIFPSSLRPSLSRGRRPSSRRQRYPSPCRDACPDRALRRQVCRSISCSASALAAGIPCNTIRDMTIHELIWPEDRVAHITQHGVRPEEVEDVCFGRALVQRTGR